MLDYVGNSVSVQEDLLTFLCSRLQDQEKHVVLISCLCYPRANKFVVKFEIRNLLLLSWHAFHVNAITGKAV